MVELLEGKSYFIRRNKLKFYMNHLECPTTLDRWRRFDFKPMSNRSLKRYNKLCAYIKDFRSRHPHPFITFNVC